MTSRLGTGKIDNLFLQCTEGDTNAEAFVKKTSHVNYLHSSLVVYQLTEAGEEAIDKCCGLGVLNCVCATVELGSSGFTTVSLH
jgi:hypothetical protein